MSNKIWKELCNRLFKEIIDSCIRYIIQWIFSQGKLILFHINSKKAMKRNQKKISEGFCFQLTGAEFKNLKFQSRSLGLDGGEYGGWGHIGKNAQLYDAFSLIVSLIQKAEKEITLIDGYVDVKTLNLLSKKNENVSVTIYTQKRTRLSKTDVENFNAQYPTLEVKYITVFHDRFLILDRKTAYHVGASLKDAGKKCFGINLIQDAGIIKDILQRLELETEE